MPAFKLLRSETVLEGRVFKIRHDVVRTPSGQEAGYDIVEHRGSVVMIPIDEHGNLIFVRQFRPATGIDLLELPAGALGENETREQCAARELREETGMAAGTLKKIGEFYLAPGYSSEFMAAFVATELRPDPLTADADEFLQLETLALREAYRAAASGAISDAKSLAALFLARPLLLGSD